MDRLESFFAVLFVVGRQVCIERESLNKKRATMKIHLTLPELKITG